MTYGTVNADTLVTSTSGGILGAGNASIMKNRIINGDMRIFQRGASVTSSGYFVDRWQYVSSQASKGTANQSSTAPTGFINSSIFTSSSAYSIGSGDYFCVQQYVEGFNISDLGWGTANAKTVTLSFQVQSSLTGTFGGAIGNGGGSRGYPFTYTISAANTWTTVSVTIAGDTTGTWATNNTTGLVVSFGLGVGSTYTATAGSWQTGNIVSATGATSVVGTSGATFYITGVQLEVGSSATGFEYVNYQTSLANCQRYYQKITNSGGTTDSLALGIVWTATQFNTILPYIQNMRSTPTATSSTSTAITLLVNSTAKQATALSFSNYSTNSFNISGTSSGMTAGQAGYVSFSASTDFIALSAEL